MGEASQGIASTILLTSEESTDSSPCKPYSLFYQIVSPEHQQTTSLSPSWLRLEKQRTETNNNKNNNNDFIHWTRKTDTQILHTGLSTDLASSSRAFRSEEEGEDLDVDLGVDEAVSNADLHAQELDYQQELFERRNREREEEEVVGQLYASCTQDSVVGEEGEEEEEEEMKGPEPARARGVYEKAKVKASSESSTKKYGKNSHGTSSAVTAMGKRSIDAQHKRKGDSTDRKADQHTNRPATTTTKPEKKKPSKLTNLPSQKILDEEAAKEWIRMRLKREGLEEAMGEYDFDVEIFEDGVSVLSDSFSQFSKGKKNIEEAKKAERVITKVHVGVQVEQEPKVPQETQDELFMVHTYDKAPSDRVRRASHCCVDSSPDLLLTIPMQGPSGCEGEKAMSEGQDEVLMELEDGLGHHQTQSEGSKEGDESGDDTLEPESNPLMQRGSDVQLAADALQALSTMEVVVRVEQGEREKEKEKRVVKEEAQPASVCEVEAKKEIDCERRNAAATILTSAQAGQEEMASLQSVDNASNVPAKSLQEDSQCCNGVEAKPRSKKGKLERLGEVGREFYQPRRTGRFRAVVNYSESSRNSSKARNTLESEVEELSSQADHFYGTVKREPEEEGARSEDSFLRPSKRAKVHHRL